MTYVWKIEIAWSMAMAFLVHLRDSTKCVFVWNIWIFHAGRWNKIIRSNVELKNLSFTFYMFIKNLSVILKWNWHVRIFSVFNPATEFFDILYEITNQIKLYIVFYSQNYYCWISSSVDEKLFNLKCVLKALNVVAWATYVYNFMNWKHSLLQ